MERDRRMSGQGKVMSFELFMPVGCVGRSDRREQRNRDLSMACGQKTQPNHNSFAPTELRLAQNLFLSRCLPLTFVGPGNMVKFFRFTIENSKTP